MFRKALLGIAASLMTFSAFGSTVLIMAGSPGTQVQVA